MEQETEQVNRLALETLSRGDFQKAYRLFKENSIRYPGYRTWNNLGVFLEENGMDCRDGKVRSAQKLARRFFRKSLDCQPTVTAYLNLGMLSYRNRDYSEALRYFRFALQMQDTQITRYCVAAACYQQHLFREPLELLNDLSGAVKQASVLFCFALAETDPDQLKRRMQTVPSWKDEFDPVDLMLLYDKCGMYREVAEMAPSLLREWSLSLGQWAVLLDAMSDCVPVGEQERLVREYAALTGERVSRQVLRMIPDTVLRKAKREAFTPVLPECCGYFGCPEHHTPW